MKNLSLRARLLLWSGAASTVTLLLVVVLVDISFRSNIRSQLELGLSFAVQVAEDARTRQMESRISETVTLAIDTRLRAAVETGDPATVRQTLVEVSRANPAEWSAVVRLDGSVLAATGDSPVSQLQAADRLISEARDYDTADLWRVGDDLVQVAASAILFGADPLAILVTGHLLDGALVGALETAVGRPVAVLVGGGLVLGVEAERLSDRGRQDLLAHSALEWNGLEMVRLGSERFLTASLPLTSNLEQHAGTVILLGSFDEALRPSNALRALLIVIFIFGILLTFVVSGLFSRGITAPVGRLLQDTERLAGGNLDDPVIPLRDDEIGQLARAFENMRISLKNAYGDLIRAERLGAIGQAASAVAHDFAQPISTIAMAVGLLRMDGNSAEGEECCDMIEAELDRLKRMKQEVLEFARGESSLDADDVRIDGFLENIAAGCRMELTEREIQLKIDHGYSGEWYFDSYRLGRVIENLTRNAAAAIGERGTITIRSEGAETLRIQVADDGPGIPDDIIEDVFEPFVSHGKKSGTGLGLAVARNVVLQHGGAIDVDSGPSGTTFTIELPRRHAPQPDSPPVRARELTSV